MFDAFTIDWQESSNNSPWSYCINLYYSSTSLHILDVKEKKVVFLFYVGEIGNWREINSNEDWCTRLQSTSNFFFHPSDHIRPNFLSLRSLRMKLTDKMLGWTNMLKIFNTCGFASICSEFWSLNNFQTFSNYNFLKVDLNKNSWV